MTDLAPEPTDRSGAEGNSLGLLTLLVVLLIGVPSKLIFSPLGSAGTPAQMLGLLALLLWGFARVTRQTRHPLAQPVHIAMAAVAAAVGASYLAAATRPIDPIEVSAADRGLISVAAWVGMYLLASDGIRDRSALETAARRLVIAGGALAGLGIVQFVTHRPWVNYIQIPGLVDNAGLNEEINRNGLVRAAGTTIHPIEFGAVLTMVLPLALHFAFQDTRRSMVARWWPVAAIALAVPISISRSAIVSAAVALAFLLPSWAAPVRRRAYGVVVVLIMWLYLTVPGLIGTLRGLFTGISADSSTKSRTESYRLAYDLIGRAPWFGRGFRTFLPSYRILDNQYLAAVIEIGFVGTVALLGLFVTAVATMRAVRRHTTDAWERSLAQSLAASVAAAACSFALYDALSFPMAASLLFLVLGFSSALRRLVRQTGPVAAPGQTTVGAAVDRLGRSTPDR